MARMIIATFVTATIWLLFKAPLAFTTETGLLLFCALLGGYMVIWNDMLFDVLGGDNFTYGLVARAVAFIGFLITLGGTLRGYYLAIDAPGISGIVSPFNWIIVIFGLFVPLWLPLASRRDAAPLPRNIVRREYENPRQ